MMIRRLAVMALLLTSCVETRPVSNLPKIISALERGDAKAISDEFHMPTTYREEAAAAEREGLMRLLNLILTDFGAITNISQGQLHGEIIEVGVGSGDLEYWRNFPDVKSSVYTAEFKNAGAGQIRLIMTPAHSLELREVKFGLSRSPSSEQIVARLSQEAMNQVQSNVDR